MWRYGAVWLCDKLLARLAGGAPGENLRSELRKVVEQLRQRFQPPPGQALPQIAAPAEDAHWLRHRLHPLVVPFLQMGHLLRTMPRWCYYVALIIIPVILSLVYIETLEKTPVATNNEDAFRHQEGRPFARVLFIREWPSSDAVGRLLGALLRNSMNTEVVFKPYPQDSLPGMLKMLSENHADIAVSVWLPETHRELVREYGKQTVDLGAYLQGARMGLAVPDYVPARSMKELKAAAFGGQIFGIDPESGLNRKIRLALEDYGLEGFQLIEKNDRYLLSELGKALKEKKPLVFAAWTPDWIFGEYPVRMLEDPASSFGEGEGIHLFLSTPFADQFPRVSACLRRFRITPQELSELMARIRVEKVPGEAVREWILNHREQVNQWLEPMLK